MIARNIFPERGKHVATSEWSVLNSSVEKFVEKKGVYAGKISVLNVFWLFALM
jgi:hypothetical protein